MIIHLKSVPIKEKNVFNQKHSVDYSSKKYNLLNSNDIDNLIGTELLSFQSAIIVYQIDSGGSMRDGPKMRRKWRL